jgi:uncharacterized protein (DUF2267 family)
LFHSARWKAYLRQLQDDAKDSEANTAADDLPKVIYHIFHSQKLWFTRDEANNHQKEAAEYMERCDTMLQTCTSMVDALEEKLANTPKPSEVLDWYSVWF